MISSSQFSAFAAFLKKHSGYVLDESQSYVVESRLPAILSGTGCENLGAVIDAITREPYGAVAKLLLQIMTVNETMFFRDTTPFVQLADRLLPQMVAQAGADRVISIWCCACSSGQEPYSLAMVLDEEKHKYPGIHFRILATDLSGEMVEKGRAGIYSEFEVTRGLSEERRGRYFTEKNGQWHLKDQIRSMVEFSTMNLLDVPPGIGPFDLIFCRNVLIYFDGDGKRAVLSALRRVAKPKSYLIAGAAEVLLDFAPGYSLVPDLRGVYCAV